MSLLALPNELLCIIGDFLEIQDLYALIRTCITLHTVLGFRLYRRALQSKECKNCFLSAVVGDMHVAVSNFLKAGLQMDWFKDHNHSGIHPRSRIENGKWVFIGYAPHVDESCKFHPLLAAASLGLVNVIKVLLHEGRVDIEFRDFEKKTPLCLAIQHGQRKLVEMLLEDGANPINDCPGEQVSSSAFALAARLNKKRELHLLLEELRRRSTSKHIISHHCQLACAEACFSAARDTVEYLLHQGVDVNSVIRGYALLWWATTAIPASLSTVELLLKHGARTKTEKETGIWMTMYMALQHGRHDMMEVIGYLLENGFDVANGGLHGCALWFITEAFYRKKLGLLWFWKRPIPALREILLRKGFDKAKCRHGCWEGGKYRWRKLLFDRAFFDYIEQEYSIGEVGSEPRNGDAKS